ncbi:MAG: DUF3103 domain-containing protein [Bacteroidales bacterium]|jgi:hypothetical protein|nr:DUF3103 domain-containing protein [Bacteroidales bacterium]
MVTGCATNDDVQLSSETTPSYNDKTFIAKEFAKILAASTEDADMRDFIKETSLKKFDGDNNFLFVQVENEYLNPQTKSLSSTFKEKLREKSQVITKSSGNAMDFDELIASIKIKYPLLQVAVPDVYENSTAVWNTGDYKPLVAFLPENFDDTAQYITAFDIDGKEYELDAQNPPENPVIVVSENERVVAIPKSKAVSPSKCQALFETVSYLYIDAGCYRSNEILTEYVPHINYNSNTSSQKYTPDTRSPQRSYNSDPPLVTRDDVITKAKFVSMEALKQVESWANGAPEVEMVVTYTFKQNNTYSTQTVRKIFTDSDWTKGGVFGIGRSTKEKTLDVPVLYWDKDNFGILMKYTFIEVDGGSAREYTISYNNTYKVGNETTTVQASTKIPIEKYDDIIGEAVINYNDTVIGSGKMYSTGLLNFWIALQGTY